MGGLGESTSTIDESIDITVNNERLSKGFWIWGQFNESSTRTLESAKKSVDEILNGPTFNVHLTLCGPFSHFDSSELKKLSNISKRFDPFKIYLEEVQTKEEFYQSLFIKIIEKEDLLELKNHIDSEFMMPKKNFFPHISLFYGKEKEEKKAEAISKTINMKNSFVLDKISLVDVNEDINLWKILKTYSLFNLPRSPR